MSTETRATDPTTLLQITPPMHFVTSLDTFNETITISTSEQVNSVNFTITYNSTLLGVVTVNQGSFFPPHSPPTYFAYTQNSTAGTINFDVELLDPQTQTGNGTLATVTFVPKIDPKSFAFTPIRLSQILILNAVHLQLTYDTLNAMCFWTYLPLPPPPVTPRLVDVYTQRSGIGPNTYGGEFAAGTIVILAAHATYNGYPVQHVPVAFQVLRPEEPNNRNSGRHDRRKRNRNNPIQDTLRPKRRRNMVGHRLNRRLQHDRVGHHQLQSLLHPRHRRIHRNSAKEPRPNPPIHNHNNHPCPSNDTDQTKTTQKIANCMYKKAIRPHKEPTTHPPDVLHKNPPTKKRPGGRVF